MNRILLAGGTGYLGGYILSELLEQGFNTTIIVRNENKLDYSIKKHKNIKIIKAEITKPTSFEAICKNIDVVISTIGITRQKDGLTYMDVDYQANLNLLNEAKKQGVKKFIYVSVLNGDKLRELAICKAKEKFVDTLKKSGLKYCIIRPNGFFSDMGEFYEMAKNGRIYLFGNGKLKSNPIHGIDLAPECVKQINTKTTELKIGGCETLTQNAIAKIAFKTVKKTPVITHIPNWVRIVLLKVGKIFMSKFNYGPFEFFMTVMSIDMIAPEYGNYTLKRYYKELNSKNKLSKPH